MGKIKQQKTIRRNNPLDQQILEDEFAKSSLRVKIRRRQEEEEEFVNDKLSKKILKQARKQQEDIEEEIGLTSTKRKKNASNSLILADSVDLSCSEDECDIPESNFHQITEIDEDDERAFNMFMCEEPSKRITLVDAIKEKLTEKETEIQSQFSVSGSISPEDLEKIKPLYRGVAELLSRYRSGKLPRAFKTIPSFSNWEDILYLTEPENWTAAAMYQATRIFASNLKDKMAQRFYNLVLLPRLRDDIAESKMLNFHLYQALKKAIFKPAAFFKGIILPLCEAGDCTLREATIFGSVLAKCSIPVLHSSVAIIKIADMEYTGANSIFLRILLEKKYALPFRAVDSVVAHFLRFALDKRELPLLWHQCLLTFAQRYKNDISSEQQEALLNLLLVHRHQHVTPEIRRELHSSNCRQINSAESEMIVEDTKNV